MTPKEQSPPADLVATLGERILAELDANRSNNTLTRWLAHHTAALLQAADHARDTGAPDADARATEARTAILQLWQHRSAWPAGWPPPRATKIVELLDDLPDLDEPRYYRASVLGHLHNLHHQILATLVDLATSGDVGIEQGWLDTFGDRLTADETRLLTRAADTDYRLVNLLQWWERATEQAADADGSSDVDREDAEATGTPLHPVATLAERYRQAVFDLLDRPGGTSTDCGQNATDPNGPH